MIPVHLIGALQRDRTKGAQAPAGPVGIPPELTGTIPRNVTLAPGGVFLTIVAAVMAAGALVAAVMLTAANARSADQARLRARDGVTAQAEVTSLRRTGGDSPRIIVNYRYDVDGLVHGGEARLREREGRGLAVGNRIGIRYLRSEPAKNWLGGRESDVEPPIFLIPLISLSMLGAAAAMMFGVRRQWLLLADGRPALARITATKTIHQEHGHSFRVNYEFTTLSGAKVSARCDANRRPGPVGSIVPIVYHRESPKWSAMYPLQFVRPTNR